MDTPDDDLDLSLEDAVNAAIDEVAPAEDAAARAYSRDEAGRFAARQQEEAAAAAASQAQPAAPPAQAPWKPVWYKDDYGPWDKIGEPLRNALRDREQAFERKLQETGRIANAWAPLEQSLAPYAEQLAGINMSPQQYFGQLHAANEFLRNDPVQGIQWLAQEYGVDLVALADEIYALQSGEEGQAATPEVAALKQHIARLEQQIGGVTQFQQTYEQQQQAAQQAALQHEIETFSKDKPHFDTLRSTMSRLIVGGEANGLQDAYEKALWLHPETRERIQSDQRKAEIERARAKASAPRGAPLQNGSATPAKRPTEDIVRDAMDGVI